MTAVWLVATQTSVEFLWLNIVGAVAVCAVGVGRQRRHRRAAVTAPPR